MYFCHNMSSNETISSGDSVVECFQCKPNQRNSHNYESVVKQSLANNDLIIDNIFKWLSPSQVIKCSQVCHKWRLLAQHLSYKNKYFSHKLLYFGLLSTKSLQDFRDKYRNVFNISLEEMTHSFNSFVAKNRLMEFTVIIVFSKLDYHQFNAFLTTKSIPNDSTIVHINCRNEVIGSQFQSQHPLPYIESEPDFDLLSGISALFISTSTPGIEVKVYEDSKIVQIRRNADLKAIIMLHVWRSLYGHFSRLKTNSEFVEHLENFVNSCDNSLAFGGVTAERLVASKATSGQSVNSHLDYICCITFSGPNVRAFSFVIDFEDNIETQLKSICDELELSSDPRIESIGFVFDENIRYSIIELRKYFKSSVTLIGCAGISHGRNSLLLDHLIQTKNLFFKRRKCVLIVIQLNKDFDIN